MVLLTQLPSEIINNIFGYVAPDDLPSIRRVCRRLAEHVKGNSVLHRDIYYRYLDEPPGGVDWEQSLNDLAKLRRLCGREYDNVEVSCPNIHKPKMTFVHHAVTNLLKAIPPSSSLSTRSSEHSTQQPVFSSYPPSRNAAILSNLFSKESVRNAFLQGSQLYERAHCFDYLPIPMRTIIDLERSRYVRIPVYIEYQQQSAKMHCLFGVGVQAPATLTLPNNPALSSSLNLNPYPAPTPGTNSNAHVINPPSPPLPTRDGQLRSAFFGRTSRVPKLYPYAVSKVYDLREYTARSKWGPFRADGSGKVDWEKLEAILLVLRTNIKLKELDRIPMVGNVWNTPFAGCWEGSLCELPRAGKSNSIDGQGHGGGGPMGVGSGYGGWFLWGNLTHEEWDSDVANDGAVDDMEEEEDGDHHSEDGDLEADEEEEEDRDMKLEMEDPYGVSGVWLRVVCFLDYTDFFSFNFPDDNLPCPESVPRPPLDVGEATKLLMMKIHVTSIVYPEPGMGFAEVKGKMWPIVHWRGYARSFDGSPGEARLTWGLRGVVQMTPEGEVRWTTSSLYDGEERWRSEGIQIGGVRSARGVAGNWFDKDYNPHGPCGPTAFWKISDLEAARPRGGHGGGQQQGS